MSHKLEQGKRPGTLAATCLYEGMIIAVYTVPGCTDFVFDVYEDENTGTPLFQSWEKYWCAPTAVARAMQNIQDRTKYADLVDKAARLAEKEQAVA